MRPAITIKWGKFLPALPPPPFIFQMGQIVFQILFALGMPRKAGELFSVSKFVAK